MQTRKIFGIQSKEVGSDSKINKSIHLHSSKGIGYMNKLDVLRGKKYIDAHKILNLITKIWITFFKSFK